MGERPQIDERHIFSSRMFFNTVSTVVQEDPRSYADTVPLSESMKEAVRKRVESLGIPFSEDSIDQLAPTRMQNPALVLDYAFDTSRLSLGYAIDAQSRVEKEDDFSLTPPGFNFPVVFLKLWGEDVPIRSPFGILPAPGVVDSKGRNFFVRNLIFSDGRQTSRLEEVVETEEHYNDFIEVDREVSVGDNRYVPLSAADFDDLMLVVADLKVGHFKPV